MVTTLGVAVVVGFAVVVAAIVVVITIGVAVVVGFAVVVAAIVVVTTIGVAVVVGFAVVVGMGCIFMYVLGTFGFDLCLHIHCFWWEHRIFENLYLFKYVYP